MTVYFFPENVDALYEIDGKQIEASVLSRIANNERLRRNAKEFINDTSKVTDVDYLQKLDASWDAIQRREREYANVLIGRRSDKKTNRYYLYYGGREGAGGFKTAQDAGNWFINGGR